MDFNANNENLIESYVGSGSVNHLILCGTVGTLTVVTLWTTKQNQIVMVPAMAIALLSANSTRIGALLVHSALVLSAFSTFVLEKMLITMMGYAVAAVAAYTIWIVVSKILDEVKPVKEEHKTIGVLDNVGNNRLFMAYLVIT